MRLSASCFLTLAIAFSSWACGGSSPNFQTDDDTDSDDDYECDEEGMLECAPDIADECSGPLTVLEVPEASPCEAGLTITSDAPEDGYPVGETLVTFTATGSSGTESCTTLVTVTDENPPDVECPEDQTVVRESSDAVVEPPDLISAIDLCDDQVDVTTDPEILPNGVNSVEYTATDDVGLTADCSAEITVIEAFSVTSLRILSASLNSDSTTTVTIGWEPGGGESVTGYRVERAETADGTYEGIGDVSADTVIFTDPEIAGNHAHYRVVTMAGEIVGGTAGPVEAFAIQAGAYDLRDQTVPTVSFATTLYGVVRYPVDLAAGPYPLVILIHGNHGICRQTPTSTSDECMESNDHDCPQSGWVTTPNAEGMLFQVETLAAQGYIAATISANAMNCRDDYIPERTQLVLEHLRRWKDWNETGDGPFGTTFNGAVDLDNVGLVGHSRGGDAVSGVPTALASTPISGLTVASIFAIAPTDYHDSTPEGVPYAVLLPACDGDVSNLMGMDIYDRALDTDDTVERAQVFYIGANHNYFSTEWYSNDGAFACSGGDIVGKQAQQGMLEATEGAWFNGTLKDELLDPFVRAEGSIPTAIDVWAGIDLDLRWSYSAPSRLLIDMFEGTSTPNVNLLGGPNSFVDFTEHRSCFENDCDSSFDHQKGALYMRWDYDTAAGATWDLQGQDTTSYDYFSFRVVSRWSTWNEGREEQSFRMRFTDTDSNVAEILVADVQPIKHIYSAYDVREILQTVRVPLTQLTSQNPDFDPNVIDTFEIDFELDDDRGSILVTDVELAE